MHQYATLVGLLAEEPGAKIFASLLNLQNDLLQHEQLSLDYRSQWAIGPPKIIFHFSIQRSWAAIKFTYKQRNTMIGLQGLIL